MSYDVHGTAPSFNKAEIIENAEIANTALKGLYTIEVEVEEALGPTSVWAMITPCGNEDAGVSLNWTEGGSFNTTLRGDCGDETLLGILTGITGIWLYDLSEPTYSQIDVEDLAGLVEEGCITNEEVAS